jgi:hypothetical protein
MTRNSECARFEALMDRVLLDDSDFSAEEARFLDEHRKDCGECATESGLWQRLSQVRKARVRAEANGAGHGLSAPVDRLLGRSHERRVSLRRQRIAWVVAPITAVVTLLAVLFVLRGIDREPASKSGSAAAEPVVAQLGLTSGIVRIGGKSVDAGKPQPPGQLLSTTYGMAVTTFEDGARMIVESETVVVLTAANRRVIRGSRFEVVTPVGRVEVVGTLFQVEVKGRRARVHVASGRVRFVPGSGPEVIVSAGETFVTGKGVRPISGSERAHLLERQALAARLPARADGVLMVKTDPKGATVRLDGQRLGPAPLSVGLTVGEYGLGLSLPGFAALAEQVKVSAGERTEVRRSLNRLATLDREPPAVSPPTSAAGAPRARPTQSVADLLDRIRTLRAQKKWSRLLSAYKRLRRLHPGTPEAHTCLALMGHVYLRHLGKPAAALRLFNRYLRRGGSLAPEAAWGRIRALDRLGRTQAAIDGCRAFLNRYPKSIYARQVRSRLKALDAKSR